MLPLPLREGVGGGVGSVRRTERPLPQPPSLKGRGRNQLAPRPDRHPAAPRCCCSARPASALPWFMPCCSPPAPRRWRCSCGGLPRACSTGRPRRRSAPTPRACRSAGPRAACPPWSLTIEDRLAGNVDDDAIYLLVDPMMRRIAGNLERWPATVRQPDAWYEMPVRRAGITSLARMQRYDLPNGFHLLIGRDVRSAPQLRTLLTDALLWALVIVGAMATAGALLVRSLFRRTLANVSATASAIAAGDFAQRVKLSGRGDEFDQLAETINDMLDRIGRLMDGVRQVSNAIAHDLRTPITRARTRLEDAALHAQRRTRPARRDRARHCRPRRHRRGVPGAAAHRRDRGGLAPLGILPVRPGAAARRRRRVVRRGGRGAAGDAGVEAPEQLPLLWRPRPGAAGGGQPGGQRGEVLAARRRGAASAAAVPGGVEIVVADQGPGIPAADRTRATERFFRGEAARSTPGAGLGSPWCRRWRSSTRAACGWTMPGPACARC